MKKQVFMLVVLVATGLIAACVAPQRGATPAVTVVFPTATSHFFFDNNATSRSVPISPPIVSGSPTVASIFHLNPTPTSLASLLDKTIPVPTPIPNAELTATSSAPPIVQVVAVYEDNLNPDWELQKSSGFEIYFNDSSKVHKGQSAISFTPHDDFGILFFTVTRGSQAVYPRDRLTRLSFWLYCEEDEISLDEISIAIVSSNSSTYWSADNHSITNLDDAPVLSETRTYPLPYRRAILADTWAEVELDFDKILTKDPAFPFITGFFLKTGPGVTSTFIIDDITLEMIGDSTNEEETISQQTEKPKAVQVHVDPQQEVHAISPLIYGVSGAPASYMQALNPALNSWGGNASTRYNWENGHAWNSGADDFYRNTNFGVTSVSASDDFVSQTLDAGAEVRLTLPILGWVAKNDDPNTCSFSLPDGTCGDAGGASCLTPGAIADPYQANVPSYLSSITTWVQYLTREKAYKIRFFAMDHAPELWGITHYDVHPGCTTYDEILSKYLLYTRQLHSYVKDVEFVGPVTSGWEYYWDSAAGEKDKAAHGDRDFLPWFLNRLRVNDQARGWRSLHVLDIQYYPAAVTNDLVDEKTAALRLRSTRSLWDEAYVDESWINEPVYLIPRMKALIDVNYPGTKLGISEWNWGAENTMNGALAIADVLGIYGREDLYYAAYAQYPALNSPGFFAFKMYTNFDDLGSRFGDTSIMAKSSDENVLSSYAALDSATGDLHVMLVNKRPDEKTLAQINLGGFLPEKYADMYRYDAGHNKGIARSTTILSASEFPITLPAYSITLLILHPQT